MTAKRITILLIALCAFTGAAVGGVASMPVAAPDIPATAAGGSAAATDAPATATGGSAAANSSTGRVSDCDLIDIDGNNNTVSTNISNNATGGDGMTVRLHCGADNATTIDHDLIDVDGNNNSVTVAVRVENGTFVLGQGASAANTDSGLHIASQCGGGTFADCDAVDIDGNNNSVTLIVQSDAGRTAFEFGANDTTRTEGELGANDADDDGDGAIDEDDEGAEEQSNDDDDGDGAVDEDDESDDGDDGADDFNGNAEDDDDGDGATDEDDESDNGNSDDIDNDGDGAVDEDDERDISEGNGTNGDN